ncbi:MAG TPA: hypothetical protein VN641_17245 [Urbifossiella sp.]|jgi:hypothetical protein|nr:hypothetical protein [Urbifossiella sp.]
MFLFVEVPRIGDTVLPTFEPPTINSSRLDQEVVELPLLLPRWQATELEVAARERGMTTGQMLRRVIGELLADDHLVAQA